MLLVKIGGSLIATKNTDQDIDFRYLNEFRDFLKQYQNETILLVHGTGNVGHGFVKRFGLSQKNKHRLRKDLDGYFHKIDEIFSDFQRVNIEDVVNNRYQYPAKAKIICGGDITDNAKIISSDDAFSSFLSDEEINRAYILTDVNGIFDGSKKIIETIDRESIRDIYFRKKEGDVTGAMQHKIEKLFTKTYHKDKIVRIMNGRDLSNFKNIIEKNEGTGTRIDIK